MKFTRIPKRENLIRNGQYGNYKLEAFSIPVKDENLKLEGYTIRPSGKNPPKGYYYTKRHPKEKIVLR